MKNKVSSFNKVNIKGGVKIGIMFLFFCILLCTFSALCAYIFDFLSGEERVLDVVANADEHKSDKLPVIVIDAGHGGIDSGAVAPDGTMEKGLNLQVALRLHNLFSASGITSVLTRNDDVLLCDDSIKSHRKMNDLKNRLLVADEIISSGRDAVLLSIHMNNFSSPKYSGFQVWYGKNAEGSRSLAACLQLYGKTWLDSSNNREIKAATSSIYLLDRAKMNSVLIECGFLSNAEELEKLKSDSYQKKLAAVIFSATVAWLENTQLSDSVSK